MFTRIGSQFFFHGHLRIVQRINMRYLLLDEMMEFYCVILGIQVETVLLVKVTGVFEFGLYHWETIHVCQMGDRTRIEQSSSEVLFGVVRAVYWSGFYSDGCGMDRTAQGCWNVNCLWQGLCWVQWKISSSQVCYEMSWFHFFLNELTI